MSKATSRFTGSRRRLQRELLLERVEDRSLLASDWQNPGNRLDVDDSGLVTPLDALVVINALGRNGSGLLPAPGSEVAPPPYLDVTGNGFLEPLDALAIINYLNLTPPEGFEFQRFHVDVA